MYKTEFEMGEGVECIQFLPNRKRYGQVIAILVPGIYNGVELQETTYLVNDATGQYMYYESQLKHVEKVDAI